MWNNAELELPEPWTSIAARILYGGPIPLGLVLVITIPALIAFLLF